MDNNLSTDKQLVSLVQDTEWIDLTAGHKKLRNDIEQAIESSCVKKQGVSPIMVKGAFGIGKTATLHYLFHYAWTKLGVPAFFLKLEDVIVEVRKELANKNIEKLPNEDVSIVLENVISAQLELLRSTDFKDIQGGQIYFDDFRKGNLSEYLEGFNQARLHTDSKDGYKSEDLPLFDLDKIKIAIEGDNNCLLLIDEFEAKYQELKGLIESSGGGMLRQFFDDITSKSTTNYYCIIGNGPASGYELNQDLKEKSESNAAEQRRLLVKQVQMPTVASLAKTFLKGYPKEYINFIWWLSRSRPGQIKKLKDNLQSLDELKEHPYDAFVRENIVFKEPIDDAGLANVVFLKSEIFNDYKSQLQLQIKESLICLGPRKIEINDDESKNTLLDGKKLFSVSKDKIDFNRLKDAIKKDLKKQEEYKSIDAEKISHYLDLILESISDSDKQICFGFLDKSNTDKALVETFLQPLISILYDMITIYENEHDKNIKKIRNFLLAQNSIVDDYENIDRTFKNVYDLFDINQQREDSLFIQLNLKTIREAIEQPIGSPELTYKSEPLHAKIAAVDTIESIFVWNNNNDKEEIIVIPNYENEELLESYLKTLEEYFTENWDKNKDYFGDGELITNVVYLEENDQISKFKNWLCIADEKEELPYTLRRLDVKYIDSYQIHNVQQISVFISSLTQIATIGLYNEDIEEKDLKKYSDNDNIIRIDKIVDVILDASWTEMGKQTRRTIEYYKDLLLLGDNSVLMSIINTAKNSFAFQIKEIFPKIDKMKSSLLDISIEDQIFEKARSVQSKNLFNLLLTEVEEKDISILKSILDATRGFRYKPSENKEQEVSLVELFRSIKENRNIADCIADYNGSSLDKYLSRFADLLSEHTAVDSLNDLEEFIYRDNTIASSYYKILNFNQSNIPYLNGFYFSALSKKLDYDTELKPIKEELINIQNTFSALVGDLTDKLYDLKGLTKSESELIYNTELRSYNTGLIQPILNLLDKNSKISFLILTKIICKYLQITIEKANQFKTQIDQIEQSLKSKEELINVKQIEYDKLFNKTDIHKKLISKTSTNFFYSTIFLASVKQDKSFSDVFGDIHKYKPHDKFSIDTSVLDKLLETIEVSYNRKLPRMIRDIHEAKAIDIEISEVNTLEEKINELIQISKDE